MGFLLSNIDAVN